jgi:hypothetical protein
MNAQQTALILFAVALGIVIAIASATTLKLINTHGVSMLGTIGLAKSGRNEPDQQ